MSETNCWKCKKQIDQTDKYCRYCGSGQGGKAPWYYRHFGIIMVMLMVGPFALINVFFSPVIGKKAKIIYTVIILAFTAVLVWQLYHFAVTFNNTMNALLEGNLDSLSGYM